MAENGSPLVARTFSVTKNALTRKCSRSSSRNRHQIFMDFAWRGKSMEYLCLALELFVASKSNYSTHTLTPPRLQRCMRIRCCSPLSFIFRWQWVWSWACTKDAWQERCVSQRAPCHSIAECILCKRKGLCETQIDGIFRSRDTGFSKYSVISLAVSDSCPICFSYIITLVHLKSTFHNQHTRSNIVPLKCRKLSPDYISSINYSLQNMKPVCKTLRDEHFVLTEMDIL